MTWILVIMMLTQRGAMSEQVPGFQSLQDCEVQGDALIEERAKKSGPSIDYVCVLNPEESK